MITTKDLESLGWKVRFTATAKNGGSKIFSKSVDYTIWSNADEVIMKGKTSPEFEEIDMNPNIRRPFFFIINKVGDRKSTEIWKGVPKDIQDLKRILVETRADMEWLREIRNEKINDILND